MPNIYLVVDRDEPQFKWPFSKTARTVEGARNQVHEFSRELWPTCIVVLVNFLPSHEELVELFNAQWPDLSEHEVLGLWRVTPRGALREVALPAIPMRLEALPQYVKGLGVAIE